MAFDFGALLNPEAGFWKTAMDPNVLYALGGAGAALDPEGIGGALGGASQNLISSRAMQEALAAIYGQGAGAGGVSKTITPQPVTAQNAPSLRDIKQGGGVSGLDKGSLQGLADFKGMTPPDQPGVTSQKVNPDGSITMQYTPDRGAAGGEGTANASPFPQGFPGLGVFLGT